MSSNSTDDEVYSIQHYVIKFVNDLWQVGGFLWILWFPPQIKMNCHEITKILLNVSLNTITLTLFYWLKKKRYFTIKSLTNFITSPWVVFELMTQVVIGTKYIGSCKSKYHTIMLYKLFSMYAYLLFDFISKSVLFSILSVLFFLFFVQICQTTFFLCSMKE
jgi:hypothetical protein